MDGFDTSILSPQGPARSSTHLPAHYHRQQPPTPQQLVEDLPRPALDGLIPAGAGLTIGNNSDRKNGWAHPRRCGAHPKGGHIRTTVRGSSPQVRGSPSTKAGQPRSTRLIPAGAGLTNRWPGRSGARRAHPRRCGAHRAFVDLPGGVDGSSPQVRGSLRHHRRPDGMAGLIPAGAGLTWIPTGQYFGQRAHPRRCGAHAEDFPAHAPLGGSSPQVRGSRQRRGEGLRGGRLIPAGAGLTDEELLCRLPMGAHPRRCGAHYRRSERSARMAGSSPQVRGSQIDGPAGVVLAGLIPAGAGLTVGGGVDLPGRGAHPRRCGAHGGDVMKKAKSEGSSPQVRGSLLEGSAAQRLTGLIPAGAGLTEEKRERAVRGSAHPRRCGAHFLILLLHRRLRGSSPQVRGSPRRTPSADAEARLIPAGAGLTSRRR